MRKILSMIFLCFVMASVKAQIVVPVVWPFALNSSQGLAVREIVNEANRIQQKYQFNFEHRPGAGGAVGTNHVLSQKQLAILAHSSSFFIRPYMDSEGSYDPEIFTILNSYCDDQPLALASKKYQSLNDLQKQSRLSIGVLPGSITSLVSAEYKRQNASKDIVEPGFRGTPEITTAMLGGHIDISVDFLSNVMQHDDVNILGITGSRNHGKGNTLRSQGLMGYENITASYYLLLNKNTDSAVANELNEIMAKAVTAAAVTTLCQKEFGQPNNVNGAKAQALMKPTHQFWQQSVAKIRK